MEFEELAKLLGSVLNLPTEKIRRESSFRKDLGADSLDVFQIVIGVEEKLQLEIDPAVAEKFRTVGDVADAVERLTNP